eukprot:TRINITY_DN801_c0_g1_i1.p1 TRINITY_DN801_c0_g1~~TRINITY_DN801_c0_g1_i1.p1  ORF type:complete len:298 (-),score=32.64 TRINITY_DN801_c0_g1_i1:27-920(-)
MASTRAEDDKVPEMIPAKKRKMYFEPKLNSSDEELLPSSPPTDEINTLRTQLEKLQNVYKHLLTEHSYLASMIDKLPLATCLFDKVGTIIHLNNTAKALFGISEVKKQNIFSFYSLTSKHLLLNSALPSSLSCGSWTGSLPLHPSSCCPTSFSQTSFHHQVFSLSPLFFLTLDSPSFQILSQSIGIFNNLLHSFPLPGAIWSSSPSGSNHTEVTENPLSRDRLRLIAANTEAIALLRVPEMEIGKEMENVEIGDFLSSVLKGGRQVDVSEFCIGEVKVDVRAFPITGNFVGVLFFQK